MRAAMFFRYRRAHIPSVLSAIGNQLSILQGIQTNVFAVNYLAFQKESIHSSNVLSKGSNKWSNIKHIKAAQDSIKSKNVLELSKKVTSLLMRNPQVDPKLNSELAALLKDARAKNISNSSINKVMSRFVDRDKSSITIFKGTGIDNLAIVIEVQSVKPLRTKSELRGVCKKIGIDIDNEKGVEHLFEHKGIILAKVPKEDLHLAQEPDKFPIDKFVDIAIEANAEDVTVEVDEDEEEPCLQFICGPEIINKVSVSLKEKGLNVYSSEALFQPTVTVKVNDEYAKALDKAIAKLDDHIEVINYYYTMQPENSQHSMK